MDSTRLCLAGVTISLILLSSVVLNSGSSLPFEMAPAAAISSSSSGWGSRRRDNAEQTILDLLDFGEEEEEKYLEDEHEDQIYHQREKRFPRIPMGETCESDSECRKGRCCALKFAKKVCRMRPKMGQSCRPKMARSHSPGNAYNEMFTSCPCARGLRCFRRRGKNIGVCV